MNLEDKLIRFDWAIKYILRDKANFDVLEGFLSALLNEDITILNLLDSEGNQEEANQKFNRVDLLALDSRKRKFIIEIQNNRESDYLERLLFGTSKAVTESVELGKSYSNIAKIISVSILYFNLGIGDDYVYYGNTELRGVHTGQPLLVKEQVQVVEDFEIKTRLHNKNIFPEYYLIHTERFQDTIKAPVDEWIYLFKNSKIKKEFKSKNIDKAREKLRLLNMDSEQRKSYERYLEHLAIESDVIGTARVEGKAEGKAEEKGEVIRNGIKIGLSDDTIHELTGVTLEEIRKMRTRM